MLASLESKPFEYVPDEGLTSSGFVPQTVTPPDRFLRGLEAALAGMRNPIELWDCELFSLPCREIRRLGKRFLEIADPVLMQQVLAAEADAFKRSEFQLRFTRPLVAEGILAAVGDNWRTQRRTAAPCFRQQAIDELLPAVESAGRQVVEALRAASGSLDVMPVMMRATFDVVAELLGVEAGALDQQAVDRAADDYLKGVGLSAVAEIFGFKWLHRRLPLKGRLAVDTVRREAVRAVHLAQTTPDRTRLLPRLAQVFGGDDGGETKLRDSVVAFIAAGNETAAVGLTWALHCIANDPIVQERLAEEARRVLGSGPLTREKISALDLHLRVVKEALRLFPPIALMQRTVTRAVRIGNHDLAPGDEVVCAIYVMQRSERLWQNAATFDPERFASEHSHDRHRFAFLPFGAGPHACLGMSLALMEMVALLAQITRELSLTPDPSHPVLPVMRLTLRPDRGLVLQVRERSTDLRARSFQR